MAKAIKKDKDEAGDLVSVTVSKEQVKITNMMQADWIAPVCLLGGKVTTAKRNLVKPLQSVIVDKDRLDTYKANKAFQARLDMKLLVVTKVAAVVKATMHDLTSAPMVEPPPELKGEGNQRTLDIVNSPVTLNLSAVEK